MSTVAESRAVGPLPDKWKQGIVGELWAEFFGCFILICFGDGVVAMLWALVGSGRSTTGALNSSGDPTELMESVRGFFENGGAPTPYRSPYRQRATVKSER